MPYYVYENWRAVSKAVIHSGDCGSCNQGQGCHANPLDEENGRWLGPLESIEEANLVATNTGREVVRHRCV